MSNKVKFKLVDYDGSVQDETEIAKNDIDRLKKIHDKIHLMVTKLKKAVCAKELPSDKVEPSLVALIRVHKKIVCLIQNKDKSFKCDSVHSSTQIEPIQEAQSFKITKAVVSKFVLHEHKTEKKNMKPHWDFRLENNPVNEKVISWALPKGMPFKEDNRLLALLQPTHKSEWVTDKYDDYTIKTGEYGAGDIKAISRGTCVKWSANNKNIVLTIIKDEKGKLNKYDTYVLHRMHYDKWVIFKVRKSNMAKYRNRLDNFLEKNDVVQESEVFVEGITNIMRNFFGGIKNLIYKFNSGNDNIHVYFKELDKNIQEVKQKLKSDPHPGRLMILSAVEKFIEITKPNLIKLFNVFMKYKRSDIKQPIQYFTLQYMKLYNQLSKSIMNADPERRIFISKEILSKIEKFFLSNTMYNSSSFGNTTFFKHVSKIYKNLIKDLINDFKKNETSFNDKEVKKYFFNTLTDRTTISDFENKKALQEYKDEDHPNGKKLNESDWKKEFEQYDFIDAHILNKKDRASFLSILNLYIDTINIGSKLILWNEDIRKAFTKDIRKILKVDEAIKKVNDEAKRLADKNSLNNILSWKDIYILELERSSFETIFYAPNGNRLGTAYMDFYYSVVNKEYNKYYILTKNDKDPVDTLIPNPGYINSFDQPVSIKSHRWNYEETKGTLQDFLPYDRDDWFDDINNIKALSGCDANWIFISEKLYKFLRKMPISIHWTLRDYPIKLENINTKRTYTYYTLEMHRNPFPIYPTFSANNKRYYFGNKYQFYIPNDLFEQAFGNVKSMYFFAPYNWYELYSNLNGKDHSLYALIYDQNKTNISRINSKFNGFKIKNLYNAAKNKTKLLKENK